MEDRVSLPNTDNPAQGRIIPTFSIDDATMQRAVRYVLDSKSSFESQRQNWTTRNKMKDRAYRAILEPPRQKTSNQSQSTDLPGRAFIGFDDKASSLVHDNVEAIKARLKESIIPVDKDFVELDGQVPTEIRDIRSEQLNTQLEKNDIEKKLDTVVHNGVVFGTFYISVPLVNEDSLVLTRQLITQKELILDENGEPRIGMDGNPMFQEISTIQTIEHTDKKYFGPGYDPVKDPEDIYLDMFIENIQEQPIVIRRFLVDWKHLMNGVEKGIYFEDQVMKIKDKAKSISLTPLTQTSSRSEDILGQNSQTFSVGKDKLPGAPQQYEMLQAYCDFSIKEVNENGEQVERIHKVIMSVIGNEIIQLIPNPYFHQMIPLIMGKYRAIPGEAYALSAIDPVLDMYREYNDTMNQINDAKILSLNPVKIVRASTITSGQDLDIFPGAEWTEQQPGDIRSFQFDFSPVANGLEYLELLEIKINKGMGIQRLMQGAGDQTDLDKTATGVTKVIEQADKKFRKIAKDMEDAAIRQWAEMAYKVNLQFFPLPIQIGKDDFKEINQELGFKVDGVENFFNNEEEIQKLSAYTQQVASVPGMNVVGLLLTIADKMNIEVDPKFGELFQQPPPPEPEQKPLAVSVTMPIDMTKGTLPAMAGAQILKQRGISLDLDAIGQAGALITETTDEQVKRESGILPKEFDSFSPRNRKRVDFQKETDDTTVEVSL